MNVAAFDPSVLFEKTARWLDRIETAPYPSEAAELDAVASRKKPMSVFFWTRDYLRTRDFMSFTQQVFDRGLTVVLDPDRIDSPAHAGGVSCFVLHHDQAWRVPALRALEEAAFDGGGWTASAGAQMGLLLGYATKQRKVWLAQQAWREVGWGCATLYTLVTAEQRQLIDALGRRSLGPAVRGMTFFRHVDGHAMKKNAASLAPRTVTIARAGVEPRFARKILGDPRRRRRNKGAVISNAVSAALAKTINAALRSNVQFLGARGWC